MARSEQIASLFASVGFKIDQRSLQSLDKSLSNIENRVNRLRQSMLGVRAGKNYGDAFKGLERQATGAATAIDKITKQYRSGLGPLQAYTSAAQQLAGAMQQVRGAMPTRLPRVPNAGGGAGGGRPYGRGGQSQGNPFSNAFDQLFGGGIAGFARGIMPGLAAGWAVKEVVQNARAMQGNSLAFQALRGSEAGGRDEMKFIKDFSYTNGLDYKGAAEGYKRILASSQGTSMQGKGARDIFSGVSLYGKTLGLGNEEMSRATTAISQMISKGKISSEELKGQLAESLPGAVQIFAKAMDVPVAKMFKMMEDGQVLSKDVLPKVSKLLEDMANKGGALDKARQNSLSAQNRMVLKWSEMMQKVYEGGLDKLLAKLFDGLTKVFDLLGSITQGALAAAAATALLVAAWANWPFVMLIRNFVMLNALGSGIWGQGAITGVKNLARVFMTSMAPIAGFLYRTFFPLIIIFDTIESLITGKVGILGAAMWRSGGVQAFGKGMDKLQQFFGIGGHGYDANDPTKDGSKPKPGRKPSASKPAAMTPDARGVPQLNIPGMPVNPLDRPAASITINIDGSKDPAAVGQEVRRQLATIFETSTASYPQRVS